MENAEKMYLVPQRQLDRLRGYDNTTPLPIRQTAETDLDVSIKNILSRDDLDPHEKAKQYTSLLHRYLSLIKQGDLETNSLTLTVPTPSVNTVDQSLPSTQTVAVGVENDNMFKEILKNVPSRNRKNVHYILDKMFQSKDLASWNESEFISNGSAIRGSHIFDLVKGVTASHMVDARRRPLGWREFLRAVADLNIPLATVPNRRVKDEIS